ncbi:MAG: arylsulfatase [Verrucomicrobia bacterium]|nr:arylsulfatase [Verrucomicrobiota bacterium]
MHRSIARLGICALVGACLAVDSAAEPSPSATRKPNIVFILADDLGYGDLGCFGQKKIRTPHLDRLAAEGMRLTRHYAGNAVCAPSRCVLMTGKHPGHAFIRNNRQMGNRPVPRIGKPNVEGQHPIPDETVTLAEAFRQLGYATGGFGKWGLGGPGSAGEPLRQGFDRWFGYNCQGVAHNYYPTYLWDNDQTIPLDNPPFSAHDTFKPNEDPTRADSYRRFQGADYSADRIAAQARAFVRAHKDRPFFLYWPTTVPHVALQVPDDSLREYAGLWDDPPYAGGKGYIPHFRPKAAYAAMITRMDREIGRLLELVRELGLDKHTVVVFSSDNGPLHGTHQGLAGTDCAFFHSAGGLRDGKGTLYEGGIRVPAIVRWKGRIPPGTASERVGGFEDWMPTLLELAGAPGAAPKDIDGISLAPTLLGQTQPARPFLYREFPAYGGQQSVHLGDWKGIRRNLMPRGKNAAVDRRVELYNLATDRAETADLSARHSDIVARIETIMRRQHTPSPDFPFPALD